MMIKKEQKHWAELDREGLDGIAEYLEYAKMMIPEVENLSKDEIKDLLTIYAHLLVCIKTLLLHSDENFRQKIQSELRLTNAQVSDKNYIS